MMYSIGLGLMGRLEEAQYSAHWPGTMLLSAIAIRQRRNPVIKYPMNNGIFFVGLFIFSGYLFFLIKNIFNEFQSNNKKNLLYKKL